MSRVMWLLLFIFEPLVEFRLTRPVSAGSLKVRGNIFLLCCQSYDVNFDQTGCPPLWLCCNCSYSSSSSSSNVPWKASTVRNAFFENTPPPAGSLVDILTFLRRSHTNTRRRRRSLWMRISCLLQSWLKTSAECARCSVAMGYAPS